MFTYYKIPMMLMSGIYTFRKLVLLVLGICWLNTLGAAEPEKVVYKVDIKDEIGPEVWRLARKSFDLAGHYSAITSSGITSSVFL